VSGAMVRSPGVSLVQTRALSRRRLLQSEQARLSARRCAHAVQSALRRCAAFTATLCSCRWEAVRHACHESGALTGPHHRHVACSCALATNARRTASLPGADQGYAHALIMGSRYRRAQAGRSCGRFITGS